MYVQIQSMFSVFILLHFLPMANEPPAKWKPPTDVTEPHLTKCGEPSFDDGNIIIAVEQTHFRVYGGVLASLSSVFANMFTNLQPTKANMRNYGCPLIELTNSAEDWEIILKDYLLRRYVCTNPINVCSFYPVTFPAHGKWTTCKMKALRRCNRASLNQVWRAFFWWWQHHYCCWTDSLPCLSWGAGISLFGFCQHVHESSAYHSQHAKWWVSCHWTDRLSWRLGNHIESLFTQEVCMYKSNQCLQFLSCYLSCPWQMNHLQNESAPQM